MNDATLSGLLEQAAREHQGIGAFNVVLLEHAEAIVSGAELAKLPVILQISENCIAYHGGLNVIAMASLQLAKSASVEAFVHLDHIQDAELIRAGVALGVDSVMIDASKLPYIDNVRATREMAEYCHTHGVFIEAELGEVGGKDGVHAVGVRTDPGEAQAFVAETSIDALAVAVGTSHAMNERTAGVDLNLIRRLASAVATPLVLHGSSGLSDTQLRLAVQAGMTKINISTHLNGLFTAAVRDTLSADLSIVDPRKYIGAGRAAIREETARLLELLHRAESAPH